MFLHFFCSLLRAYQQFFLVSLILFSQQPKLKLVCSYLKGISFLYLHSLIALLFFLLLPMIAKPQQLLALQQPHHLVRTRMKLKRKLKRTEVYSNFSLCLSFDYWHQQHVYWRKFFSHSYAISDWFCVT